MKLWQKFRQEDFFCMLRPEVISQAILSLMLTHNYHYIIFIIWGYRLILDAHISCSHLSNNTATHLPCWPINMMLSASNSFMLLCCTHPPPHHHHPIFTDSPASAASPFHLSHECYQPPSLPVYGLHGGILLGAAQGRHTSFTKI